MRRNREPGIVNRKSKIEANSKQQTVKGKRQKASVDSRLTIYVLLFAVCCLLFTVYYFLNGLVSIRPVFFRNEPKRESFLVFVLTMMAFLFAFADRFLSLSFGIGLSVGSGFNRGSGFTSDDDRTADPRVELVVCGLSTAGAVSRCSGGVSDWSGNRESSAVTFCV